jgi:GxxExxY protein
MVGDQQVSGAGGQGQSQVVSRLEPVHELQLLTYLRLSGRWLGLVVNFNSALVKHGLRRMLNG